MYKKQTWENGEIITAEKMNHIEDGIKSAQNVYSLEESPIGRWIDGKPIYRKVIKATAPSKSGTTVYVYPVIENIDVVLNISGIMTNALGNSFQIPAVGSSGVYVYVKYEQSNGLGVEVTQSGGSAFVSRPMTISVEYTKTIDEPTIEIPQTFAKLTETQTEKESSDLESMTKLGLLSYAADHGVEGVSSAMRKAEIIEAIETVTA